MAVRIGSHYRVTANRNLATFGAAGRHLADEFVIFGVAPNPKPQHAIRRFHSDGTVVPSNAHRPETANLLEMQ